MKNGSGALTLEVATKRRLNCKMTYLHCVPKNM